MLEVLARVVWGWPTLGAILATGAYYTLATGLYQIRGAGRWLRAALRPARGSGGLSGFQALTAALAGSLGTGNIVGVGVALAAGGPGALFWMWVSGLLGMMTVWAENVLAARHRQAPGAMGYIRALGRWGKPLAAVYAGGCCLASLGMGNMAQTNAAGAALGSLGAPVWLCAGGLGAFAFLAGRGGLGWGVKVTQRLVPVMTLLFFGLSLGALWAGRAELPRAFGEVFRGAFSPRAGAGGAAGWLLALGEGVSRGVFTNEAGLGSGAFAYGEVEGASAEELGGLGIFQVFLDTLVMCTVTGLCLLCWGAPEAGAAGVFAAYERALGPWGGRGATLCAGLFAVATLTAWCCWGRAGLFYLTGGVGRDLYALAAGVAAALGCLLPVGTVFRLGDVCNGLMAVPNLIALWALRREAGREFRAFRGAPAAVRAGKREPLEKPLGKFS